MLFALIAAATLAGCRADADQSPRTITVAGDPLLRHHEILLSRLPRPFATASAENPPLVVARPADAALHLPPGFEIAVWAANLEGPRNMALAPNGDIFVAESSSGRISLFRDDNRDGLADRRFTFSSGLNYPFGLAFHGNALYVGSEDAVVAFPYRSGQTSASGEPRPIAPLPRGGHPTRNVIFNRDGSKMYVAVGSASNVRPEDPPRAAITEMNPDGSDRTTLAWGMRNPIGLAWEPTTGTLWTSVNERDDLGDDLVPDYITDVRRGAFYGWPYSYLGPNEDPRRAGERRDLVAKAVVPSLLIEAHSAAIGLVFYQGTMFPPPYRGGAFVALHGSWNRSKRTGYKVIFVPFRNGRPAGGYDDFVDGWSPDENRRRVWGRPVGLLILPDGSLLIADDGGDVIWRVTYSGAR